MKKSTLQQACNLFAALLSPMLAASTVHAQDMLAQGKTRISVNASAARSFDSDYFVVGVGVGHFISDGLELGFDAKAWMGGRRDIYDVAPTVTYTFTQFDSFMPYIGVLYQRTFIESLDDLSAYGGRAGVLTRYSGNLLLRAGVVAVRYQNCASSVYAECSEVYPELAASVYF